MDSATVQQDAPDSLDEVADSNEHQEFASLVCESCGGQPNIAEIKADWRRMERMLAGE